MDKADRENILSLLKPFEGDMIGIYGLIGSLNQDVSEQAVIIDHFFPKYHTEGHLVKNGQVWQNKETKRTYKVIEDFIAYPPVLEDVETKQRLDLSWRELFTRFERKDD